MAAVLRPQKPRYIHGRSIVLRVADEDDAHFVLGLRLDPDKNRFVSPVENDVEKQRAWIRRARQDPTQAYFIVCAHDGRPLGTIRLYEPHGDTITWGSWILSTDAPPYAAVESMLLVYWLAVQEWGYRNVRFKVFRDNRSVLAFNERMGARRVLETGEEVHLCMGEAEIRRAFRRYAKFMPGRVIVE